MFSKSGAPKTPPSTPETIKKPSPTRSVGKDTNSAPSILSRNLVITGELSTDGDIQIEGRLEGNVKSTTLTIGEQGVVNGKITAGTVHIRGKVTGKITADTVVLAETANVLADIVQDHLTIANGAFFDGKCTRKTKSAANPTKAPAKKS